MKICLIAEGCYPYVVGGVSGWIHNLIKSFPEHEFIVLSIVVDRSWSGKFKYELPENVSTVYEAYLDDKDWDTIKKSGRRTRLKKNEYRALRSLIMNYRVEWDEVLDIFQKGHVSVDDLVMGADFLHIVREFYDKNYPQIVFSDFLWTMRSIYLPLFLMFRTNVPQADIYHCVSTGYAGILGIMGKRLYPKSKLLLSEHGIYTREREEELIKADWVKGIYKSIWIEQFRKMSRVTYDRAEIVTSLYEHARQLQIELGCKEEKTRVTPNGIDPERFAELPGKVEEDWNFFNLAAVLRVAPIKDVKTMIQAYALAKEQEPRLKLWILGPLDEDEIYANECMELVDTMGVKDVVFTGSVDVTKYLGRMDATILTSISEGQPLTILEGYASHLPVIATDVGNCRGLIYGESDEYGSAGILTHVMNVGEISEAMITLARDERKRASMAKAGYLRVRNRYRIDQMVERYRLIYLDLGERD